VLDDAGVHAPVRDRGGRDPTDNSVLLVEGDVAVLGQLGRVEPLQLGGASSKVACPVAMPAA